MDTETLTVEMVAYFAAQGDADRSWFVTLRDGRTVTLNGTLWHALVSSGSLVCPTWLRINPPTRAQYVNLYGIGRS